VLDTRPDHVNAVYQLAVLLHDHERDFEGAWDVEGLLAAVDAALAASLATQ